MSGESSKIETINELKIWLEGEFKVLAKVQDNNAVELLNVRRTVHDLANAVAVITALNIPDKLNNFTKSLEDTEKRVENLVIDNAGHKSAIATARVMFLALGAFIGTFGTIAVQIWNAAHH